MDSIRKTTCIEKLLGVTSWLDGKNACIEKLFGFQKD
jgi:hypothetical protein